MTSDPRRYCPKIERAQRAARKEAIALAEYAKLRRLLARARYARKLIGMGLTEAMPIVCRWHGRAASAKINVRASRPSLPPRDLLPRIVLSK